ncbi:hypothetical protein [Caldimonas sp. KR1-144]|uniref:hypothetical protein n=1 Tax=Caldimonas sp. KR1-144 TaxID=3400911 RepID=UPI003C01657C
MFQVGAACYESASAAAAAQASTQGGSIVIHGGAAFVVSVDSVADDSITYALNPVAGGAATVLVAPFTPQPCGLLTYADGLDLGWKVAAVWVGVWAIRFFLTRQFEGGLHGNA